MALIEKAIEKRYTHTGNNYSIDVFVGQLAGLILAEIEFETPEALLQHLAPDIAWQEVTCEPFFTGGSLITLDSTTLQARLAEYQNQSSYH